MSKSFLSLHAARLGRPARSGWSLLACLLLAAVCAQFACAGEEVLVRFRPGTDARAIERALSDLGARRLDEFPELRVQRVELPAGISGKEAARRLSRNPAVDFAEPNEPRFAAFLPSDPEFLADNQWALTIIKARMSWELDVAGATGSTLVIVAILDTGISTLHEDTGPKLVDGFNAINPGASTNDDHGHGTFVAGVAAGATDNGKGIAGVAWEARLMPVKVLDYNSQGTVADLVKGMLWAVAHGAHVINMSLSSCNWDCGQPIGSCGDPSKTESEAMEFAYGQGAVLIAAAGNSCTDQSSYPAAYPLVLGVAATDQYDNIAGFSNFGSYIDLAAPGVQILGPDIYTLAYKEANGTSVASPHVAGLAAVLLGANPLLQNEDVVRIIKQTADQPGGVPGWNPRYGYGRINMYRALTGQASAPPAGTQFAYVYPNPFSPAIDLFTTFVIDARSGERIEIKIHDSVGNLVWETSFAAPADLYYNSPVRWNGKDSNNRELANGIYFATIKAGESRLLKKIAIIR